MIHRKMFNQKTHVQSRSSRFRSGFGSGGGGVASAPTGSHNGQLWVADTRRLYYRHQPGSVTHRPVCLSAAWAAQDSEKKRVCLSLFYRGRIYTSARCTRCWSTAN